MKIAPKALSPQLRAEIGDAIDTLKKALARAKRNGAQSLKLSDELATLEGEHTALAGKASFTHDEAVTHDALITRKGRLATAIEAAEAGSEGDRRALVHTVNAVHPLLMRLLDISVKQIRAEVGALLAGYFRAQGTLGQVVAQTELEQAMVGEIRNASSASFTMADAVAKAEAARTILENVAADRDFFTMNGGLAKAA